MSGTEITALRFDVSDIAAPFRNEVRQKIKDKYNGAGPKLVGFLANQVKVLIRPTDGGDPLILFWKYLKYTAISWYEKMAASSKKKWQCLFLL